MRPRRFVDQTASRVAALCGRLARCLGPDLRRPVTLPGRLAVARCLAACALVAVCIEATAGRAMTPLLSCAALALGPGTQMLQEIAAGTELPDRLVCCSLDLLPRTLYNLLRSAAAHDAAHALAQELPPQQLLAFLRAMTDAGSALSAPLKRQGAWGVCRLHGMAWHGLRFPLMLNFLAVWIPQNNGCLGAGALRIMGPMQCAILADLTSVNRYPAQEAALQGDASLRWAVVRTALLPALRASAVEARLPPDRQPESFDWLSVCNVAGALASPAIALPELLEELLPTAPEAGSVLTQLLRSTAALLERLPAERPQSVPTDLYYAETVGCLVYLLGQAVDLLPAERLQARRQAAECALPAVHRLPTLLQLPGIGSLLPVSVADMCKLLTWIAELLSGACRTAQGDSSVVLSLQDLPAWCAAAAAMLRALPPALNLVARAAEEYASQLHHALLMAASDVAEACQECTRSACGLSTATPRGTHLALDAAAAAAAADALWSLHTACCRLAHCAAVRSQMLDLPGQELACTAAAMLLTHSAGAVADLRLGMDAASQRPELEEPLRVALLVSHIPAMDRCVVGWVWWLDSERASMPDGVTMPAASALQALGGYGGGSRRSAAGAGWRPTRRPPAAGCGWLHRRPQAAAARLHVR